MSINAIRTDAYADLGSAWVRDQAARVLQRHVQLGRHFSLDLVLLLDRAARIARAERSSQAPTERVSEANHLWRAVIEAIDHCARPQARPSPAREARMVIAEPIESH